MKLEIILGIIVIAVFLGGGIFYSISTKETVSEDTRSAGTIHNANDEKQESALLERNTRLGVEMKVPVTSSGVVGKIVTDSAQVESHELYIGASRNNDLENGKPGVIGLQTLIIPADLKANQLYLGGAWSIAPEYAESSVGSTITIKYKAKDVYLVASSEDGAEVEVLVDGKVVDNVLIKSEKLYTIVTGTDYKEHTLEIKIKKSGVKAFAFTFG